MTAALLQWQRERFPLKNGIFFVILHVTALLVARAAAGRPRVLSWTDLPGLLATWSFFLLLRVFDEHKDFAADAVAHPERVLQRGLVTLPQLARLGAAAAALQLAVSLWLDGGLGPVTGWWAATLAWSGLMAREFFAAHWLRSRILVYACSHLLVMPLVALWAASMGAPGAAASPLVWAFAALAFLGALAFEVARKIRAPEDEHPMADSYTQSLGIASASMLLAAAVIAVAGVTLALTVLASGGVRWSLAAPVGLAALAAVAAILRFRGNPTRSAAKLSEAVVAVATLGAHVALIIALVLPGNAR